MLGLLLHISIALEFHNGNESNDSPATIGGHFKRIQMGKPTEMGENQAAPILSSDSALSLEIDHNPRYNYHSSPKVCQS